MYARDAFNAQVALSEAIERKATRWLALASIGGGIGQLALIRWADRTLIHRTALAIEGSVFLLYMAIVVWLLRRLQVVTRNAAPHCPACNLPLRGLSIRLASATGKCDRCGARVIEE